MAIRVERSISDEGDGQENRIAASSAKCKGNKAGWSFYQGQVFNLSGCLAAGEQLIDKLRIEFGCFLFGLNGHGSDSFLKNGCLLHFVRLHKLSDTLRAR